MVWDNPNVQPAPPQYGYYDRPPPSTSAAERPASFHAFSSNNFYSAAAAAPTAPTGGLAYAYPYGSQNNPQQVQTYGAQSLAVPNVYPYPLAGSSAGASASTAAGSTQSQGSDNFSGTGYIHPWSSGGSGGPDQSGRR